MIRLVFIIQMNFLLKDGEWISNKEVCYVLGQQLVNSYTQRLFSSLFTAQAFNSGLSQWCCVFVFQRFFHVFPFLKSTCIEQLLVNLFVYRQINVVVLLTTARQVAVDGIVSWLEDPVFVVFQWLKRKETFHLWQQTVTSMWLLSLVNNVLKNMREFWFITSYYLWFRIYLEPTFLWCPVIHRGRDDSPATINIWHEASVEGWSCTQRHLSRATTVFSRVLWNFRDEININNLVCFTILYTTILHKISVQNIWFS